MPEDDHGERRWIVEPPPSAGEVSLYLACGEAVDLNAEQEAALSALLHSLEARDAEVTGYNTPECPSYGGGCGDISECQPLKCGKVNCSLICVTLNKVSASASTTPGWNLMGSFSFRSR